MRTRTFPLIIFSFMLLAILLPAALAKAAAFPLLPGISITGVQTLSPDSELAGSFDMMLPFYGGHRKIDYFDVQSTYFNSTDYNISMGLGKRVIAGEKILGAYLFADDNHTAAGRDFWFISPGVERQGPRFDMAANLYLPVGSRQVATDTMFGEQLGLYDHIYFAGHTQYDARYFVTQNIGPGADIQIGYHVPVLGHPTVYLVTYYADTKNTTAVHGANLRLEIPKGQHLRLLLSDSYDNRMHNTVKLGVTLTLGGRKNRFTSLTDDMLAPVQRNIAMHNNHWHSTQPMQAAQYATGQTVPTLTHIAFFTPTDDVSTAAIADGTYEHPYHGITQADIDAANGAGNRNFYIQSGSYVGQNALLLDNDNLYGRTEDHGTPYARPAWGEVRPELRFTGDAFMLQGNNTLDGLVLMGNNQSGVGISALAKSNMALTDTISHMAIMGFQTGILAQNNGVSHAPLSLFITQTTLQDNDTGVSMINNTTTPDATLSAWVTDSNFMYNDIGFALHSRGASATPVFINQARFDHNDFQGIYVLTDQMATGAVVLDINHATFTDTETSAVLIIGNANAPITARIQNTLFDHNDTGLEVTNANNVSNVIVSVDQSTFSNNQNGIALTNVSATTNTALSVTNSVFAQNQYGLQAQNFLANATGTMNILLKGVMFHANSADVATTNLGDTYTLHVYEIP